MNCNLFHVQFIWGKPTFADINGVFSAIRSQVTLRTPVSFPNLENWCPEKKNDVQYKLIDYIFVITNYAMNIILTCLIDMCHFHVWQTQFMFYTNMNYPEQIYIFMYERWSNDTVELNCAKIDICPIWDVKWQHQHVQARFDIFARDNSVVSFIEWYVFLVHFLRTELTMYTYVAYHENWRDFCMWLGAPCDCYIHE